MYYNFEKLNVWIESRLLIKKVYEYVGDYPKAELFALSNQTKRAAVSVALNIAEGSDKRSTKDFIRYLRIALGSVNELVTALYIANDLDYLKKKSFDDLYLHCHKLSAMANALVKKLDSR